MFIAVINENFDVAEEHKRSRQATSFWNAQRPQKARAAWIRRMNPYRWFDAKPKAIAVDQLPSSLVLPMQKSLVQDYTFPTKEQDDYIKARSTSISSVEAWLTSFQDTSARKSGARHASKKSLNILQTLFTGQRMSGDVPLTTIRAKRESVAGQDGIDEETERHL